MRRNHICNILHIPFSKSKAHIPISQHLTTSKNTVIYAALINESVGTHHDTNLAGSSKQWHGEQVQQQTVTAIANFRVSPDPFCQYLLTHTQVSSRIHLMNLPCVLRLLYLFIIIIILQETRKGEQSKEGKTRIKDHITKEKLELEQKAPKEENT